MASLFDKVVFGQAVKRIENNVKKSGIKEPVKITFHVNYKDKQCTVVVVDIKDNVHSKDMDFNESETLSETLKEKLSEGIEGLKAVDYILFTLFFEDKSTEGTLFYRFTNEAGAEVKKKLPFNNIFKN